MFVDVHTHLTHEKFTGDLPDVIERARAQGLGAMVVNGLEPVSNRRILDMAAAEPLILPALGIYPIDGIHNLPGVRDLPFSVGSFDVDAEIGFIRDCAAGNRIAAVGECGLDGYWVGEDTFPAQEANFERLMEIAMDHDLPLIIHTRKREQRAMEMLAAHGVKRVNFHCYGGKVRHALRVAEEHGWYFSIPANARSNQAFTKLLRELPADLILTETDAPFLAPEKGQRNEPANVTGTVAYLAELRGWLPDQAREQVWKNFKTLFALQ